MTSPVRFTNHALDKMDEREITVEEVAAVIASPQTVTAGETAVEYDGIVGGRALHVIVVRDSEPPLVITVWEPNR